MKRTLGDKIFDLINVLFMIAVSIVFIVPILYVISGSLTSEPEFLRKGYSMFVEKIDFSAYAHVLSKQFGLIDAFWQTALLTVIGTVCNLIATSAMAYGLSKRRLPFRNIVTSIVFFTMIFGGGGLVPGYLIVKYTGLLDSIWALIIPGLISPWNLLILRNFFMSIPESLEEAALIDGANEIKILYKIILPLSLPALATIALFHAVAHWNSWFGPLMYIPSGNFETVQLVLRKVLSNEMADRIASLNETLSLPTYQIQMAALMVATVPIMCVYPFIQKYFIKGVMVGSVKG